MMEQFMALNATIPSWDTFKTCLDAEFVDTIKKEIAYLALTKLWQGPMTANEFITKFDHLTTKARLLEAIHNDLLITLFEPTLSYTITDQIYSRINLLARFSTWKKCTTDIRVML